MLDRDLQEFEEYDARLLDVAPFTQGTGATLRSANESRQPSFEPGTASEGPFLLDKESEITTETGGMAWERGGRTSAHRRPKLRTGRSAALRSPGCNCDCDGSTDDPVSGDADEYSESEGLEEMETEGMAWERGGRTSAHRRPRFRPARPATPQPPGCTCNCDGSTDAPVSGDADEYSESEVLSAPSSVFKQHSLDGADGKAQRVDSFEFDPYAAIRTALVPEHASLPTDEVTVVLGRLPALVALHLMLDSPEPRLATLAALLGKAGKRSMRLNGSDVPIPSYLRLLSHLSREASEQMEGEQSIAEHVAPGSEGREIPMTGETFIPAEHPFVSEAFELPVAVEGQVAPAVAATPLPRDLTKDAFFEDEWVSTPTPMANPRNVHFSRFTTLTATSATEQTVLTHKPNPLDPRVTPGLIQPEVIPASRSISPGELYWIYVPEAYKKAVKDAVAAGKTPPTARVSVLFGVAFEVNRHGLRSFFASTADRVLIEVGGVESVPEATGPWGIGITDAMVLDLLNQAVGTKVTSQIEVLAAYSTGYRGINGTINNALIDLTHLKKMIFFDCLYRADEPQAPSGAVMPPKRHREAPKSAFNTWRAVQAVLAASSTCNIIVYDVTPGGTPTYSDGSRKVDIPGATFIELKSLNVELKAIILARLIDNGIKDGYFTDTKVPAGIRDLIPLLPTRGTLLSGASSATPGTIGKWAKDNSTRMAHAVKGFATAMELARTHKLMGWATPPTEFGHDGFLPEFGWEHLAG